MKYLKTSSDQRIIKDLIKLALPGPNEKYDRLFLIGFHAEQTGNGIEVAHSTLINDICKAKKPVVVHRYQRRQCALAVG